MTQAPQRSMAQVGVGRLDLSGDRPMDTSALEGLSVAHRGNLYFKDGSSIERHSNDVSLVATPAGTYSAEQSRSR